MGFSSPASLCQREGEVLVPRQSTCTAINRELPSSNLQSNYCWPRFVRSGPRRTLYTQCPHGTDCGIATDRKTSNWIARKASARQVVISNRPSPSPVPLQLQLQRTKDTIRGFSRNHTRTHTTILGIGTFRVLLMVLAVVTITTQVNSRPRPTLTVTRSCSTTNSIRSSSNNSSRTSTSTPKA